MHTNTSVATPCHKITLAHKIVRRIIEKYFEWFDRKATLTTNTIYAAENPKISNDLELCMRTWIVSIYNRSIWKYESIRSDFLPNIRKYSCLPILFVWSLACGKLGLHFSNFMTYLSNVYHMCSYKITWNSNQVVSSLSFWCILDTWFWWCLLENNTRP